LISKLSNLSILRERSKNDETDLDEKDLEMEGSDI